MCLLNWYDEYCLINEESNMCFSFAFVLLFISPSFWLTVIFNLVYFICLKKQKLTKIISLVAIIIIIIIFRFCAIQVYMIRTSKSVNTSDRDSLYPRLIKLLVYYIEILIWKGQHVVKKKIMNKRNTHEDLLFTKLYIAILKKACHTCFFLKELCMVFPYF